MPGSERRSGLKGDSAVSRLVGQAQARQAEIEAREAGKDGRGKPAGGGRLGRDVTGRAKLTIDLSLVQQKRLRRLAQEEDVLVSDLVGLAIARLLADIQGGQLDLEPLKSPARSLKAAWKLNYPETGEAFDS